MDPLDLLSKVCEWEVTPTCFFNICVLAVGMTTVALVAFLYHVNTRANAAKLHEDSKPKEVLQLQYRFLSIFWILKCADWLQGPYFYEVYASKVLHDGTPVSLGLVGRLFLTGFASTAFFGPYVGRAADQYGSKKATVAFTIVYSLGALSTKSSRLSVLFVGRIFSGIGTSLLFSAPESWLVGEFRNGSYSQSSYLEETFAVAYEGDSCVAILAGQMAAFAVLFRGPTGPFELSAGFLMIGGLLAAWLWRNQATGTEPSTTKSHKQASICEALHIVQNDPKIMLVGSVQALFESAMYIFVLQWAPAIEFAVQGAFSQASLGEKATPPVSVPYGTIFSCFMACSLLGSILFGQLSKTAYLKIETAMTAMLTIASLALAGATWILQRSKTASLNSLLGLMTSFFTFEACIGMYFPLIGSLRSKHIPDSRRALIMNLFGIPLNMVVVFVFLSMEMLGIRGALSISSGALASAAGIMHQLSILDMYKISP